MITQVRAKELFVMRTVDGVKQLCWRIEGSRNDYPVPTGDEINIDGKPYSKALITQIYLTGRPPITPTLPQCIYRMDNGKYRVLKRFRGKLFHIGYFDTLEEAQSANH